MKRATKIVNDAQYSLGNAEHLCEHRAVASNISFLHGMNDRQKVSFKLGHFCFRFLLHHVQTLFFDVFFSCSCRFLSAVSFQIWHSSLLNAAYQNVERGVSTSAIGWNVDTPTSEKNRRICTCRSLRFMRRDHRIRAFRPAKLGETSRIYAALQHTFPGTSFYRISAALLSNAKLEIHGAAAHTAHVDGTYIAPKCRCHFTPHLCFHPDLARCH